MGFLYSLCQERCVLPHPLRHRLARWMALAYNRNAHCSSTRCTIAHNHTNKHNKQTHIHTQTDAHRTTLAHTPNVHCIVYNTQISSARYVYELSCIIWDPALASVI